LFPFSNYFSFGHIAIASREFYGRDYDVSAQQSDKTPEVVVHGSVRSFKQEIVVAKHSLVADEPVSAGGGDAGPDPYDYLLTALGVCTSMTVGLYARRKNLPLETIKVSLWQSRIYAKDCEECETKEGMLDRIDVEIELTGPLSAEQRDKLMEIAAKCPVHRTLTSEINIRLRPPLKSSAS
jgi:putative redox protein